MKPHSLRFRQVHLDFHTSPAIPGIGSRFDKRRWQDCLREAAVDSITLFSKCHHGWSYHPTKVGRVHPGLSFDLLRAQYDACKEIGINVPVYLSAGLDNVMSHEHPEWRELDADGRVIGAPPLKAGFHKMDFLSPYLDYLCRQIEEAARLFPECDGIFLDIVSPSPGCSRWALDYMKTAGLDPRKEEDRKLCAEAAGRIYCEKTNAAARSLRADMPVFHNSGHIPRGRRDVIRYQSHLELESLPTGGWGYDHFPESASYVAQLGMPYLGMTGKFHTTWGEFGGLKHPNALKYECAAMLAFGARCSVGDQLHPDADLDASTYAIIGNAYRDVRAKEAWCAGARSVAQIAILSSESEHPGTTRHNAADTGATRVLLEEHHAFAMVDRESDWSSYDIVIFPDDIRLDEQLEKKTRAYLGAGGKLFLTGESGLRADGGGFALDIGAEWMGASEYSPEYILPRSDLRPDYVKTPFVVYARSQRIKPAPGSGLGDIYEPYFNRTFEHFCSHQHAPGRREPSGFAAGSHKGNILYLAHAAFTGYRAHGQVVYRQFIGACLRLLLNGADLVKTNLPSTGRVTVTRQEAENRNIVHLLYANTVGRGGALKLDGGNANIAGGNIEIIEDIVPLYNVGLSLRMKERPAKVTLEPQGEALPFDIEDGERIRVTVPRLECHQMVVFQQ